MIIPVWLVVVICIAAIIIVGLLVIAVVIASALAKLAGGVIDAFSVPLGGPSIFGKRRGRDRKQ